MRKREGEAVAAVISSSSGIFALNPCQRVLITLLNILLKAMYHVFLDNLFSSSDLFQRFHQHGHGATGTA